MGFSEPAPSRAADLDELDRKPLLPGCPGRGEARERFLMGNLRLREGLERETGFEPATNSLEGCDSTPELLPRIERRMVEALGFEPR